MNNIYLILFAPMFTATWSIQVITSNTKIVQTPQTIETSYDNYIKDIEDTAHKYHPNYILINSDESNYAKKILENLQANKNITVPIKIAG